MDGTEALYRGTPLSGLQFLQTTVEAQLTVDAVVGTYGRLGVLPEEGSVASPKPQGAARASVGVTPCRKTPWAYKSEAPTSTVKIPAGAEVEDDEDRNG